MIHGASVQKATGMPKASKTIDLNSVPDILSAPAITKDISNQVKSL